MISGNTRCGSGGRWHEHRWPIFNIADAALLVGVVLLVFDSALAHRRARLA